VEESDDLRDTLGSQEGPGLEFKRELAHRDVLGKAICALANDLAGIGAGDLVIGVTDKGATYPTDTSDGALLNVSQIRDEGNILPRPSIVVTAEKFAGEPVVRVHVSASAFGPVRFKGIAWVRPGPMTKQASPDDERVLTERLRSGQIPPDLRPVESATLSDLDVELIRSTYIPSVVATEVIEENGRPLDQQCASLRLIDLHLRPTLLGVLLAAYDPTAFVSGAYVQFVRYDGIEDSAPISDDEEIRDNLITAGRKIADLLQINIRSRVSATGALREVVIPDYPLAALRESFVNALVHRVYDASNAPVRVLWYSDRVEILSPGGPFGVVTEDNFRRTTDYRNPNLAAAMKALGYLNRFGRGIARIETEMARNGNPPPEYDIGQSWWSVILRSAS